MWKTPRCTAFDGQEVVCWDLDSSVRSTMQRRWKVAEVRAGRATWDDYSMLASDDTPMPGSVALMRMLDMEFLNFAVSGTSSDALDITAGWAALHDVPLDDYMLRPAGSRMPVEEWKVRCIRELQSRGLIVKLFVEDWAPAARFIAEHTEVPVLGINPFDPDTILMSRTDLSLALDHRIGPEGLAAEPGSGPELAGDVFDYLSDKTCL